MARGVKTGGRKKGTPNKFSNELREQILTALELSGGEGGAIEYLRTQALANPTAFLGLIGKVLPSQSEVRQETEIRYVARIPDKATTADTWQQQHDPHATTH
jgi:hypothetical protein